MEGIKPSPESQENTGAAEGLPAGAPPRTRVDACDGPVAGWFVAAIGYAILCSLLALQQSFSADYVVQDDARQHVTWLLRFIDPGLFPNDLLADYFQSLAPAGYSGLYRCFAWLHVDAITGSKILPGVLAVICAAYCFGACRRMMRAPSAAFFATVILMQSLWMNKDLASATPRAFLYPLFLAFLYYAARPSRCGVAVTILLQGLFYPPIVLISLGVLALSHFKLEGRRIRMAIGREDLPGLALTLAIAAATLALYSATSSHYGPLISLQRAQGLADFHPGGRIPIFGNSVWYNWVKGTGGLHFPTRPYLLWLGLLVPWMCWRPSHFSMAPPCDPAVRLLPRVALVSLGLFVAARLCLFHLYLPSRYTQHTARMVLSLTAGMALAVILQWLLAWARRGTPSPLRRGAAWLAAGALFACVVGYPAFLRIFPMPGYVIGRNEELYAFLARQPKDALVASLCEEANNLPSFARRSTLVGREFASPFHVKYYDAYQERVRSLMEAQYTDDPVALRQFVERYHVSYFLLDRHAFERGYLRNNSLAKQFRLQIEAIAEASEAGARPIIADRMREGIAFSKGNLILLEAAAILRPRTGAAPGRTSPVEDGTHAIVSTGASDALTSP